jgi:hypothetical protein
LRTIDGVGVQSGLYLIAYMFDISSGVEVPAAPTTTLLRSTGAPSWKAISS